MNSELLRVVEQEARAEAERLVAEARSQADQVVAQAVEKAARIREDFRLQAEADGRAAEARARSAANLEAQALLLEAKSRAVESLFAEAAGSMDGLKADRRRRVLKALMAEAAGGIPGRVRLGVSGKDEAAARELAGELGLEAEVAADPGVKDGVVATSADGSAMVCNRVSDRLEQARPLLTADIARMLWG